MTGPQHYHLQFSTTEEHAQLVDRAKALLARSRPGMTLGELHLEAMRLLVASLEKRRFGAAAQPRTDRRGSGEADTSQACEPGDSAPVPLAQDESEPAPRQRGGSDGRSRSRYIPATERREVFERDGGRCSYVDARGERCCETRYLELHHLQSFAKDGPHLASNLTLRCAAHNALAAEDDFGAEVIAERRDATRHEALRRQHP